MRGSVSPYEEFAERKRRDRARKAVQAVDSNLVRGWKSVWKSGYPGGLQSRHPTLHRQIVGQDRTNGRGHGPLVSLDPQRNNELERDELPAPLVSRQKSDLRFSYAVCGLVIVARMPFAPPSPNRVPGETEARALKALLRHDISLQLQLEEQQLHRQGQAESADRSAASLRECGTRAELVQAIYREMVEVTNKLIAAIELATEAHDQAANMMENLSSIPRARNAFSTMSDALKTILIDSEPPIVAIKSHTHLIDVECKAFELIGVSAKQSLSLIDLSLDAITTGIEEKKGLLHPIRRVPSEVLENIFIEFVEEERDRLRRDFSENFKPMERTMHFAPFFLSAVCHRWRCISVSLPRLWTYLRIPTVQTLWSTRIGGSKPRNLGVKLLGRELFEQSLARSKWMGVEATLYPSDDMATSLAFMLNIPPSTRLDMLNVLRFSVIPVLWCTPSHLRIVQPNEPQFGPNIQGTELSCATRGINRLTCWNTFPRIGSYSALKELHFQFDRTYHSITDIIGVLQQQPKLRHLSFAGEPPELLPETVSPVVYLNVSRLEVPEQFINALGCMLKRGVYFASLKQLIVHGITLFDPSHYREIASVLSIVSTVTIFNTCTSFPEVQTARTVFDLMDNVHSLRLSGPGVELMVDALSVDPPKSVTNLLIENWDGNGREIKEYTDKLKDQNQGKANPIQVSFIDCPNVSAIIQDQIGVVQGSDQVLAFEES